MTDPDWSRRATSFGSAADDYARYRPAPPREAAEWAVPPGREVVLDIGAGTGHLTTYLLDLAGLVVALDLDARMLAALGRRLPGAERVVARGEVLPLRDGAVGGVTISSAWHWLDPAAAWPELARVIRPGGAFAVLWSGPDRDVPWVRDVLGARRVPRAEESDTGQGVATPRRRVDVPEQAPFSPPEHRTFLGSVPFAVADLPGLAASYSRVRILPDDERDAVMRQVASRAARCPELDAPTVELPIRCLVWRTVRT